MRRAWGSSRIFTPQLVVNGEYGVVGSKPDKVDVGAARCQAASRGKAHLRLHDMLDVNVAGRHLDGVGDAVVWLVTFIDRGRCRRSSRGENQGKKIGYTQIVTGRQALGMWDPTSGASLKLPLMEVLTGEANGAAILVQQDKDGLPGPILGAASFTR